MFWEESPLYVPIPKVDMLKDGFARGFEKAAGERIEAYLSKYSEDPSAVKH